MGCSPEQVLKARTITGDDIPCRGVEHDGDQGEVECALRPVDPHPSRGMEQSFQPEQARWARWARVGKGCPKPSDSKFRRTRSAQVILDLFHHLLLFGLQNPQTMSVGTLWTVPIQPQGKRVRTICFSPVVIFSCLAGIRFVPLPHSLTSRSISRSNTLTSRTIKNPTSRRNSPMARFPLGRARTVSS